MRGALTVGMLALTVFGRFHAPLSLVFCANGLMLSALITLLRIKVNG